MDKEKEFSETILSIKKVLEYLEFNNNILVYELDYIRTMTVINAAYNYDAINIRVFKYRILPAIDKLCDNINELKFIKARALHQMADLQGKGRG